MAHPVHLAGLPWFLSIGGTVGKKYQNELHELAAEDLLAAGWTHVEEVQFYGRGGRHTVDLLGVADLLALRPGGPCHLVQVTDGNHSGAHRRTLEDHPNSRRWLEAGGTLELLWYSPSRARRTRQELVIRPGGLVWLERLVEARPAPPATD